MYPECAASWLNSARPSSMHGVHFHKHYRTLWTCLETLATTSVSSDVKCGCGNIHSNAPLGTDINHRDQGHELHRHYPAFRTGYLWVCMRSSLFPRCSFACPLFCDYHTDQEITFSLEANSFCLGRGCDQDRAALSVHSWPQLDHQTIL